LRLAIAAPVASEYLVLISSLGENYGPQPA
jgi:hypothetical protein